MAMRITTQILGHEVVFEFADPYGAKLASIIERRGKRNIPTAIAGYPVSIDGNKADLSERVSFVLWSIEDASFVPFRDDELDDITAGDTELQVLNRLDYWEKIGTFPFMEDGSF
ncbi:hypothetical protein [Nesterenkonia sp.]|uniref:hypothetical protein n=1 Tax=Nesterenkonia sp. TaxID=704201 RepID=UPI00262E280A|nr:hypothetical protein [Nesterenkonia sp.]